MAVYVITMVNIHDQEKYKAYAELATVANQKHGGKFMVRGGNPEPVEGRLAYERVVVNMFDTREQARTFYHSVEYQAAKAKREGAADFNMIIVDGV